MEQNTTPLENQRFIMLIEKIKKQENFKKDSQVLQAIEWDKGRTVISEIKGGRTIPRDLMAKLSAKFGAREEYVRKGELPEFTNGNQSNAQTDHEKTRIAAEEAVRHIEGEMAKRDAGAGFQQNYNDVQQAALYVLGVSHQSTLVDPRNIEALLRTVDDRVRLILLEAIAVKRIYQEVAQNRKTSYQPQV